MFHGGGGQKVWGAKDRGAKGRGAKGLEPWEGAKIERGVKYDLPLLSAKTDLIVFCGKSHS